MSEQTTCQLRVFPKSKWGYFHAHTCGRTAKGEVDGKPACGLHIGAKKRSVQQRAGAVERYEQQRQAWRDEQEAIRYYPALLAAARAVVVACAEIDWEYLPDRTMANVAEASIEALAARLPDAAPRGEAAGDD